VSRPPLGGFFDRCAPSWDNGCPAGLTAAISKIFAVARLHPGSRILDVGAGTGILYPFFLKAGAGAYTAVDSSPAMVQRFKAKHPEAAVLEADYEKPIVFPEPFDVIMIFNAFPHFRDEEAVFRRSRSYLSAGGRLFICHSMNREALNAHHRDAGGTVAGDVLISDARMAGLYRKAGFTAVRVENTDHFYSEGTK